MAVPGHEIIGARYHRAFEDPVVGRVFPHGIDSLDRLDPFGECGNQSCGFDDRILFPSEFISEHRFTSSKMPSEMTRRISPLRARSRTLSGSPPKFRAEM